MTTPRSLARFAAELGGQLVGPDRAMTFAASTDSRTVAAGELFFALRGERFDGHEFCAMAAARGVAAAVVGRTGTTGGGGGGGGHK